MQIIRKVLACVRWEAKKKIEQAMKESKKMDQTELDAILDEIMYGNQESYREDIMDLFKIPVPEGETAKRVMQKAYLKYSTVSSIQVNGLPIRARWQD